jgi:hypothetical protein
MTLDRDLLCRKMELLAGDPGFCRAYLETRPHLFYNVPVFLPMAVLRQMQHIITAIETTVRLPIYKQKVLSWAPEIARVDHGPIGVFMGYDFHVDDHGPRLIEINTNAGGGVLNALLAEAQHACCAEMEGVPASARPAAFADTLVSMFKGEWRRQRGERYVQRIAIVDEAPETQYLYPEFVLLQKLLEQAGIETVIAAPEHLAIFGDALMHAGKPVDLVYNRLVDFAFEREEHGVLRSAYERGLAVVTPNPHNHALFADKRNLAILSDPLELQEMGVSEVDRAALAFIPRTMKVTAENANEMWIQRKSLFFKPVRGHGSKAVYRGDKVTRGVWEEIRKGGYVAQQFAAPSERMIRIDGQEERRKMDVRLYTYDGKTLVAAARLYQGQATNFRTPGGGFAPVFAV